MEFKIEEPTKYEELSAYRTLEEYIGVLWKAILNPHDETVKVELDEAREELLNNK